MLLKDLLEITCLETRVKVEGIDSNRNKSFLMSISSLSKYGKISSSDFEVCVDKYGENKVLSQHVEDNELNVLIKL